MAALLNTVVRSAVSLLTAFDNVLYPPHCLLSGLPISPEDEVLPGISRQALDACPPAPDPIDLLLLVQRHIAADDLAVSSFHALWAVTDDSPIRHAIHAVKYHNRKRLAYEFGCYLGEEVKEVFGRGSKEEVREVFGRGSKEEVREVFGEEFQGVSKEVFGEEFQGVSLKESLIESLEESREAPLLESLAESREAPLLESLTESREASRAASLVVPIPIHAARRRERGFNQAELIARGVADALGVPMLDVLRRTRYTGTQTALSEQQRLVNLTNAFEVPRPAPVRNARILLVDDVLTTGATLNTAAEALLMAGARKVDALTIGATL